MRSNPVFPELALAADQVPATFLIDGRTLVDSRQRIQAQDLSLKPALDKLLIDAAEALRSGSYSIMNKQTVPPSGDKHDYTSLARYWWPDPAKLNGLPFIWRDGETNPESQEQNTDYFQLSTMAKSIETLSVAYFLTGKEQYVEKAQQQLRTWFLNSETRMNPNLNYSQAIRGVVPGRRTGVLDGKKFCQVLDGIILLSLSKKFSVLEALRDWFSRYLNWLKTSKLALEESEEKNNHGTFFDVQIMHIALFVGDTATARQVAQAAVKKRILQQISSNGKQPHELKRTRTLHYTLYNLWGLFLAARLAEHVDVDLWDAENSRLRAALDFVAPYADPTKKWPHPTINEADRLRLFPHLQRAAAVYENGPYKELIEKLPLAKREVLREQLVAPLAG